MRLLAAFPHDASGARRLRARLLDTTGATEVAAWSVPAAPAFSSDVDEEFTSAGEQAAAAGAEQRLLFQQRVAGPDGVVACRAGAAGVSAAVHEIWAAPPAPGRWRLQLQLVKETRGWMSFAIAGLPAPLQITLTEAEEVVRVDLVVPPPAPHDEDAGGPLPDYSTPPAPLPRAAAAGEALGLQLTSPAPGAPLEADRPQRFEVAFGAPGAVAAVRVGAEGCGWAQLLRVDSGGGGCVVFVGEAVLPRSPVCFVRARLAARGGAQGAAAAEGEVEVLRLSVLPQVGCQVCRRVCKAALHKTLSETRKHDCFEANTDAHKQ